MICVNHSYTDPYFNMAVEEYLLRHKLDDIFLLWRNEPAIVIGRYQNTLSEINEEFVKDQKIKVVRRLTGGGAVFHDLGNLNFTFIKNGSDSSFKEFTQPIIDFLQSLGVDARFEGRNDLTISGLKFSGNAMLVDKNRTLEHGTLLFTSKMTDLSAALKSNPLKFTDKAVKSIKSRVTNISQHLPIKMDVLQFRETLLRYMCNKVPDLKYYKLTSSDLEAINELKIKKYQTWDWNYGHSPKFTIQKLTKTQAGNIEVHLAIDKGRISAARVFGDFFGHRDIARLEEHLIDCEYKVESLQQRLSTISLRDYILNISLDDFIAALV